MKNLEDLIRKEHEENKDSYKVSWNFEK